MTHPLQTTSFLGILTLREDLPRDAAIDYWAKKHGEIVRRSLPGAAEYVQRHFSPSDHGFWPASPTVGTAVPAARMPDGFAEVRFKSALAMATTPLHFREVFFDEQNVFARVLGHPTAPRGGRWWTDGHDDTVGQRVALLLRRRRGVGRGAFKRFVYERMARGLLDAGARDLRAYVFLPWTPLAHQTPGVAHDNPVEHRYHALINFGLGDRAAIDELLASPSVARTVAEQHTALTAVHAFAIERSVPVVSGVR